MPETLAPFVFAADFSRDREQNEGSVTKIEGVEREIYYGVRHL